jgi:hypothetical protein
MAGVAKFGIGVIATLAQVIQRLLQAHAPQPTLAIIGCQPLPRSRQHDEMAVIVCAARGRSRTSTSHPYSGARAI